MEDTIRELVKNELLKAMPRLTKSACKPKKGMETSKAILWAMFALVVFCVVMCFVFAAIERIDLPEHVYDVIKVVIGIFSIIASGYFTKSYGEKASRNKNKLDADGNPMAVYSDALPNEGGGE